MIDHNELETIAEIVCDADGMKKEYEFRKGYVEGFKKAVHFMEVLNEKRFLDKANEVAPRS